MSDTIATKSMDTEISADLQRLQKIHFLALGLFLVGTLLAMVHSAMIFFVREQANGIGQTMVGQLHIFPLMFVGLPAIMTFQNMIPIMTKLNHRNLQLTEDNEKLATRIHQLEKLGSPGFKESILA